MPERFIAMRDEAKAVKNRSPASLELALNLYLETKKWQLSECTSNNKQADINQIKHHCVSMQWRWLLNFLKPTIL